MRRLTPIALAFALLPLSPGARAQAFSVYALYTPAHLTDAIYTGTFLPNGSTVTQNFSAWTNGATLGATVRVVSLGPFILGVDLRGAPSQIGTPGIDDLFAGVKLGVRLPRTPLKPYVQASGGLVDLRTTASTTNGYGNFYTFIQNVDKTTGAYIFFFGADYPLRRFLDLRVLEVGVGRAAPSPFGSNNGSPDHVLFTLNSGFVAHF
jgi:hypothetical protein